MKKTLSEKLREQLQNVEKQAYNAVFDHLSKNGHNNGNNPFLIEEGNRGSSLEDDNVPIITIGAFINHNIICLTYERTDGFDEFFDGEDFQWCSIEDIADQIHTLLNILQQFEKE
jgi:hypothetical protein